MNLERLLENTIFTLGSFEVTGSMLVLTILLLIAAIVLHRLFFLRILPWLLQTQSISSEKKSRLLRSFNFTLLMVFLLGAWAISGIDLNLDTLAEEAIEGDESTSTRS